MRLACFPCGMIHLTPVQSYFTSLYKTLSFFITMGKDADQQIFSYDFIKQKTTLSRVSCMQEIPIFLD